MGFVHLHVHTEYSLLDGSNKISEYVARVKELGMDSAAITDHGVRGDRLLPGSKKSRDQSHPWMRGLCGAGFQVRPGDHGRGRPLLSSGPFGGE